MLALVLRSGIAMTDFWNPVRYQPLPGDGREWIRLLSVLPGAVGDDMCVEMLPEPIYIGKKGASADILPYEALSYCWESPVPDSQGFTTRITLVLDQEYHTVQVTRNLASALQHLRHVNRERVLWIDALCIDQVSYGGQSCEVSRRPFLPPR